jgi:23S rRNA pseudouridine1911/1915/1917 synthase
VSPDLDLDEGGEEEQVFAVPGSLAGERIDRAVALLTGWSRADVVALIDTGEVMVGGEVVRKSRKLVEGDEIVLTGAPEVADERPRPEPVDFRVLHADDTVIVVSKPAGLVVHPGAGHATGTLAGGLLHRFPDIEGVGDPVRPGIVHRLDRDTSGLMVVARTPEAHEALTAALADREVERRYQALAWGRFENTRGLIDAPIGRSTRHRTRMAVRESGREARTGYEVVRQYHRTEVASVACRLETGRTHQIRVHLRAIGHPVVGDPTYDGDRPLLGARLGRPFLHAELLAFIHPQTGERVEFTDPLPADLAAVLVRLDDAE